MQSAYCYQILPLKIAEDNNFLLLQGYFKKSSLLGIQEYDFF